MPGEHTIKTVFPVDSDKWWDAEKKVSNFDVVRTYELCSDTTFNVGSYQDIYNHEFSGNKITLRPNLHIQCGSNGRRANNCVINGGSLQLDGSMRALPNSNLHNIVLTGITFQDAKQHVGVFQKPGNVLFRDCEFRVRKVIFCQGTSN